MSDEEDGFTDSDGKLWTLDELRKEGFDVAYIYCDKNGKPWMRLRGYEHITPPNKRFNS